MGALGRKIPEVGSIYNRAAVLPGEKPSLQKSSPKAESARETIPDFYRALAPCQDPWQRFLVRNHFRSPEARRWREEIEAERLLAHLDLFEDLAQLAAEETIAGLRDRHRTRYEQLIGIEPERREELRSALTRVVDGAASWHDEVANLLQNAAQQNGSSAGG